MPTNFGNVELPENFSEKELRWSYWWINHREQMRRLGFIAFIALDVILMGVGIWGFTDWLAFGGVNEQNAARQMTGRLLVSTTGSDVKDIQIDGPIVFSTPGSKYDLIVRVENPNPAHWVELSYRFTYGGGKETEVRRSFILPGQVRYLAELGVKSDAGVSDVQLKPETRAFHRIDRHAIPNYETWLASRLTIDTLQPTIKPPDLAATVPYTTTGFTVFNRTAFSYYDVDLLVLAYRNEGVVGVNQIRLNSLSAGEKRPVELFWYQSLSGISRIEVIPEINVFDPRVYRPPGT